MKKLEVVALASLCLMLSACPRDADAPGETKRAAEVTAKKAASPRSDSARSRLEHGARIGRARGAVSGLKKALKQALQRSLPEGLPEAIASCQLEVPEVAAAVTKTAGVQLGRASSRLRNPANAAEGWTAALLGQFEADPRGKWPSHRTADLPDGRLGYAEPIVVQGLCLTCHGKQLAPAVTAALDQRYPQDKARGYGEGDLRGIFWAIVP